MDRNFRSDDDIERWLFAHGGDIGKLRGAVDDGELSVADEAVAAAYLVKDDERQADTHRNLDRELLRRRVKAATS
jgi:predicted glutamine amidotransferase